MSLRHIVFRAALWGLLTNAPLSLTAALPPGTVWVVGQPDRLVREGYVREMRRYGVLAPESDHARLDPYQLDQAYWRSLWPAP
jgi:hypothetical protein